jgi:S-adenosyl-L-methionine hydrolase (adenosine-forming)
MGEIIHIDHFGNLRTNITAEELSQVPPGATMEITVGGHRVKAISAAYTTAEDILALLDSRNHLEIAKKNGSAAKELGCRTGEKILIVVSRPKEK